MIADATTCTRGIGECFVLSATAALFFVVCFIVGVIAIAVFTNWAWKKRKELGPIEQHVFHHEDPETIVARRIDAAHGLIDLKGRLHPLEDDDPFAILSEAVSSERRRQSRELGR